MNKLRQQFEAYFLKKPQNHIDPLKKDQFGYYYYLLTRGAWDAWQASRESLDVELPKEQKAKVYDFYTDGYNSGIDCCEVILESMGIKVIKND